MTEYSVDNDDGQAESVADQLGKLKLVNQGGGDCGVLKGKYVTVNKRIQLKIGYNHCSRMLVSLSCQKVR